MQHSVSSLAPDCPRPGEVCHGFVVRRIVPLPEIRCTAIEALHQSSGARLLHLYSADPENLFAVAFRTLPTDDTGLAHIVEHCVLSGSRKFPVKDPFSEMLKRSAASFLNAVTCNDKTLFPAATAVPQDYFNLAEVYLDAVFHPCLSRTAFLQEGHRLDFTVPGRTASPLTVKGIVYNEMKGDLSELEAVVERTVFQHLFPDSIYGHEPGGDPAHIPDSTYAQFRAYHRRHYQPRNAYFCLYGNIPTRTQLAFLGPRLAALARRPAGDVVPGVLLQPRWRQPRELETTYPLARHEGTRDKTVLCMSWLAGSCTDPQQDFALSILDRLLLGSSAAPLHRALIESGLGEDLLDLSGYSAGTLETSFHAGLRGAEPGAKSAFTKLVLHVLRDCARHGFPRRRVDAVFQQMQYGRREIQPGYPLQLMDAVYDAWVYDLDPLLYLRAGELLDALQARCHREPDLFPHLIRQVLLDNPHRLTAVLRPDPGEEARREAAFAAKLAARKAAMSPAALRRLAAQSLALARRQAAPNSRAALATLPTLPLSCLPPEPLTIPAETLFTDAGVPFIRNDLFSNGVNYAVLAWDLTGLPTRLWRYLPLFTDILTHAGAGRHNYAAMAERMTACTGGVEAAATCTTAANDPHRLVVCLTVGVRALDRHLTRALDIVRDLLLDLDLSDTRHLADLMKQTKIQRQTGIVGSGHRFAGIRAARAMSTPACLADLWEGVPQVRLSTRLANRFPLEVESLRSALEDIRCFLLDPRRLRVSFTGTPALADKTLRWLATFTGALAQRGGQATAAAGRVPAMPLPPSRREGLVISSDVAFCAMAMPAPHGTSPDAPALRILATLLSLSWLWEEIRVKGDAYDAFCGYEPGRQVFDFLSFRDPNPARTLAVFAATPARAAAHHWTHDDVQQAILTCAKGETLPVRPLQATMTSLWDYLMGYTHELRRARYAALLTVTPRQVRDVADRILVPAAAQAAACVVAGRRLLEDTNLALPPKQRLQVSRVW